MTQPGTPATDPFALWRDWLSNSERQWNAFLNEAMSTDQFSQSMGRFMDVYLNLQKSMNETMGRYFSALNMPTRTDVLSLGTRLSGIEDRLTALEAAIARLAPPAGTAANGASTAAAAPRPARTKKPPSRN